jgi:hypothetical protein
VKSRLDRTSHTFPVQFHSLRDLLLLLTQSRIRALVKLLGGNPVEAQQFHTTTQSHWSSGSTVCFRLGGQQFASQRFASQWFASQWLASQQFTSQPFASQRFASQRFASRGCTNSQWNRVSPDSAVSLQNWLFITIDIYC